MVQEVTLAKDLEVWCGTTRLGWAPLVGSMDLLQGTELPAVFNQFRERSDLDSITRTLNAVAFQNLARWRLANGLTLPLLYVLSMCRATLATDDRDKLYSVLSLVCQDEKHLVVPDYTLLAIIVYISFAKRYIETTGVLQIITFAQENPPAGFPSWVPNWNLYTVQGPLSIKLRTGQAFPVEHCAHRGISSTCHFSEGMQAITCQGICFDDVDGLGAYNSTAVDYKDRGGVQSSTRESA